MYRYRFQHTQEADVIARREKSINLIVCLCKLVMHYFTLAADTTHHGHHFNTHRAQRAPFVNHVFIYFYFCYLPEKASVLYIFSWCLLPLYVLRVSQAPL